MDSWGVHLITLLSLIDNSHIQQQNAHLTDWASEKKLPFLNILHMASMPILQAVFKILNLQLPSFPFRWLILIIYI